MAEYEDDYDDDLYYEDDYLYVEDPYGAADELVETSVPSPPMMEPLDEDVFDDHDHYDYWMDIEYGSNEIYDIKLAPYAQAQLQATGLKRKVHSEYDEGRPKKKQRMDSGMIGLEKVRNSGIWKGPNVVYRSSTEHCELRDKVEESMRPAKSYSLLPDWRTILRREVRAKRLDDEQPHEEMSRTATASEDQAIEDQGTNNADPTKISGDAEDWEDAEDTDGQSDLDDAPEAMDPAVLVNILQSQLGSSGLDAERIQQILAQVMEEGGSMDDILEKLTAAVVEQVEAGGVDSGTGQWLRAQGVNLGRSEVDDADAAGDGMQDSDSTMHQQPPDAADELEGPSDVHKDHSTWNGPPSGGHTRASARKRKAAVTEEHQDEVSKRTKPSQQDGSVTAQPSSMNRKKHSRR